MALMGLCRLCANDSKDLVPLLETHSLVDQLFQLFSLKITLNDVLPTKACNECVQLVNAAWSFAETIKKSQEILSALVPEGNIKFECKSVQHNCDSAIFSWTNDPNYHLDVSTENDPYNDHNDSDDKNEEAAEENEPNRPGWDSYPWKCSKCDKKCKSGLELSIHYVDEHCLMACFKCVDCLRSYTKYTVFIRHVRNHRAELNLNCDICYKWYESKNQMSKHQMEEHQHKNSFVCPNCDEGFRLHSALLTHLNAHLPRPEDNKRFQCDICPKSFAAASSLSTHKRIHDDFREFVCHMCGKAFIQKGNLSDHMLTHTTDAPVACKVCNKSFKSRYRLNKHLYIHTGVKQHTCEQCGRQFLKLDALRVHHRIHTGSMPFKCNYCFKSFRFKGVLTTHIRLHTGDKPYSCKECTVSFISRRDYNKHMKLKHDTDTRKWIPNRSLDLNTSRTVDDVEMNNVSSEANSATVNKSAINC